MTPKFNKHKVKNVTKVRKDLAYLFKIEGDLSTVQLTLNNFYL